MNVHALPWVGGGIVAKASYDIIGDISGSSWQSVGGMRRASLRGVVVRVLRIQSPWRGTDLLHIGSTHSTRKSECGGKE